MKIKLGETDVQKYKAEIRATKDFPIEARIAKDMYRKNVRAKDFEFGGVLNDIDLDYNSVVTIMSFIRQFEEAEICLDEVPTFHCSAIILTEEEKTLYDKTIIQNFWKLVHTSGREVILRYMTIHDKGFRKGTYALAFLDTNEIIATHTDMGMLNLRKDITYADSKNINGGMRRNPLHNTVIG